MQKEDFSGVAPDQQRQIKSLFVQALDCDAEQIEWFLRSIEEEAIRNEVRRMVDGYKSCCGADAKPCDD